MNDKNPGDGPSDGNNATSRPTKERRRVVDLIRRRGPMAVGDLAQRTGMARQTVTSLVNDLRRAGWLSTAAGAVETAGGTRGRPPGLHEFVPGVAAVLGIELGEDFVRMAVGDLDQRVRLCRIRERRLPAGRDAGLALSVMPEMVEEILDEQGLERTRVIGAGVSLAAPLDQASWKVKRSTILSGWVDVDATRLIGDQLRDIPVEVDNDANLAALAELAVGAASGRRDVVYIKCGTGIGCGLIQDGRLYRGHHGTAGELCHVVVDVEGLLCDCGSRGCLGTVAGAGGIVELLRLSHGDRLRQFGGRREEELAHVIRWAADGDPACRRALQTAAETIGLALANLCNVLNPELVVVGGTLLEAEEEHVLEPLKTAMARYTSTYVARQAEVVRSAFRAGSEELHYPELTGALAMVERSANPHVLRRLWAVLDADLSRESS